MWLFGGVGKGALAAAGRPPVMVAGEVAAEVEMATRQQPTPEHEGPPADMRRLAGERYLW